MPTSGLLVTLKPDPAAAEAAMEALAARPEVTLGERKRHRVSLVVETPDARTDKDVWQWLQGLPGVAFVDVAVVFFGQGLEASADLAATVEV